MTGAVSNSLSSTTDGCLAFADAIHYNAHAFQFTLIQLPLEEHYVRPDPTRPSSG
jgi:hypothetical protein